MSNTFTPGSLVRVRNRDWVVEADSTPQLLHLRPISGSSLDSAYIIPDLEPVAPRPAVFSMPHEDSLGNLAEIRLLQDAMRMKLRSGAGPFRSFGNISVEPRVYQLVPLLMALRMQTVRLLIADDVGVGKTIEAGLIVRELMDRGEIDRFSVLCPPSLVEQWQLELKQHFNINAVAVTAATANKLDKSAPTGTSLFKHYPYTVVSLDYIKSDRHCHTFRTDAPPCVVVDEAHTCTLLGNGHQQRYALLKELAADAGRHILLLTATPHSGNEEGFYNMLALLDSRFAGMQDAAQQRRTALREQLARFLVQRRRQDILQWGEATRIFPRRTTAEFAYRLSGEWGAFFDDIQAYCQTIAEARAHEGNKLIWYATLALLRCVSSSPAAAVAALRAKLDKTVPDIDAEEAGDDVLDDEDTTLTSDRESTLQGGEDSDFLIELINRAKALYGPKKDPKLAALIKWLRNDFLKSGFSPIIFCRYVHTAEYVAEELRKILPEYTIAAVTGSVSHDMREQSVEELCRNEKRILVATNCLSEGINLQEGFNAVIHYDLAWNPTRHEQREGRVDRYGQTSPEVRCFMLYGEDNPVDGFILQVILRKADAISKALGVKVPVPDDKAAISNAIMKASLTKRSELASSYQPMLLGMEDLVWRDTQDKAKNQRTLFAQNILRPEEVIPEWQRQSALLGTHDDVQRFVEEACEHFHANLERKGKSFLINTRCLPLPVQEQMALEGVEELRRIAFIPCVSGTPISRSHPLVSTIADYVTEQALEADENPLVHRAAVTPVISEHVTKRTVLYFTRMRHRLEFSFANTTKSLMAEEAVVLVSRPGESLQVLPHDEMAWVRALQPAGDIAKTQASAAVKRAIEVFRASQGEVAALAQARADELMQDHTRVRQAAHVEAGRVSVSSCLPVDLIAVSVLLPQL